MDSSVADWKNVVKWQSGPASTPSAAAWQDDGVSYSERLSLAVQQSGLKPIRIAELAGVNNGYLSKLMSGRTKRAGAEITAKLAEALRVDSTWLATGKGGPVHGPHGPYFIMKDGNPSRPPERTNVDTALDDFDWPSGLDPAQASAVAKSLREEYLQATESLPSSYWMKRLQRLVAHALVAKKKKP